MTALIVRAIDDGDPVGFVVGDVPDHAPARVREGLARQAITAATGRCPCGAELPTPSRQQRRHATRKGVPLRVQVQHEDDCAAIDPAIAAWDGGDR